MQYNNASKHSMGSLGDHKNHTFSNSCPECRTPKKNEARSSALKKDSGASKIRGGEHSRWEKKLFKKT